jgi:hypothetical protein
MDWLMSGKSAARKGDLTEDGGPIAQGSPTVLFNGRRAARVTDKTLFGGRITTGSPNVLIGQQCSNNGWHAAYDIALSIIIGTLVVARFLGTQQSI